MNPTSLDGRRFGLLTVIKEAPRRGVQRVWLCRCDCGKERLVVQTGLTRSRRAARSCGCQRTAKVRTTPEPPAQPGTRWIALGGDRFALVDDADYGALARFRWCFQSGKYAARRGTKAEGHKLILMHRQILSDAAEVDHINGNGLDNRRANLRAATHAENIRNAKKRSDNTSGYRGVSFDRGRKKWEARITVGARNIGLGRFDTAVDAARAYDTAARKHHGDFAKLNFPPDKVHGQTGGAANGVELHPILKVERLP